MIDLENRFALSGDHIAALMIYPVRREPLQGRTNVLPWG